MGSPDRSDEAMATQGTERQDRRGTVGPDVSRGSNRRRVQSLLILVRIMRSSECLTVVVDGLHLFHTEIHIVIHGRARVVEHVTFP